MKWGAKKQMPDKGGESPNPGRGCLGGLAKEKCPVQRGALVKSLGAEKGGTKEENPAINNYTSGETDSRQRSNRARCMREGDRGNDRHVLQTGGKKTTTKNLKRETLEKRTLSRKPNE